MLSVPGAMLLKLKQAFKALKIPQAPVHLQAKTHPIQYGTLSQLFLRMLQGPRMHHI